MARTKKKRDIEPGRQGQVGRGGGKSQNQQDDSPDFVKLTDISDIVSKYAVVDKLFTDDDQNGDNAAKNTSAEDNTVKLEADAQALAQLKAKALAEDTFQDSPSQDAGSGAEIDAETQAKQEAEAKPAETVETEASEDDARIEAEAETEKEARAEEETKLEAEAADGPETEEAAELETAAEDELDVKAEEEETELEAETEDEPDVEAAEASDEEAAASPGEQEDDAEEGDEHLAEFAEETDEEQLLEAADGDDTYAAEAGGDLEEDKEAEEELIEASTDEAEDDGPQAPSNEHVDDKPKYTRLTTRPDDSVSRARAHVALLREAREAKAVARNGDQDGTDANDDDDASGQSQPSIVFRRPRIKDELNSDWSANAHRAFDDIRGELRDARAQPQPYSLRAESARLPVDDLPDILDNVDDRDDVEAVEAPAPVIARHKSTLSRSVAISIGLPIATGALFAMLLYYQNDLRPGDVWNWVASKTSTQPDQTATTGAPARIEIQPETAPAEPDGPGKVAEAPAPIPASPESGLSVTPPKLPENTDQAAPVASSTKLPPKKQVYMARLTVTDSQGTSLDPIPLSLSVAPAAPEQRLRVRVSGLPDGSRLSAGTDLGHGEWVLRQDELGGLTMKLPTGFTGQLTLLAEVIDDATHIQAAPSQRMEVKVAPGELRVEPTAAPASKPRSFAEPETKSTEPSAADPEAAAPTQPEYPSPSNTVTSPFSQLQVQAPARPTEGVETQTARVAPDPEAAAPALKPAIEADAPASEPEPEAAPAAEPEITGTVTAPEPQPEAAAPAAEPAPEAPASEPEVAAVPEPAAPEAPAAETEVAALTPPAAVQPEPAAPAAAENPLVTKGDEMMGLGDIASARLLYKRALKAGDPRAATAMGKSYDPVVFEQLKVHGVIPDAKLALEWYERGESGGDVEAASYKKALNTWLNQ